MEREKDAKPEAGKWRAAIKIEMKETICCGCAQSNRQLTPDHYNFAIRKEF